eukprot:TRINITY_DN6739_c0_g1_i1.p2 TRINITY_DN6739_c0_g1~~TRINITY_DN6739_c0_g1_i1.p2  ORF type:complete len:176 (-),score=41.85 TRINITY_DN6739_c0_g1_i1:10-537(-)
MEASALRRAQPNILITGTPGTGKTSLAEAVASALGLQHIELGAMVKDKGWHEGKNDEYDTYILDEDKVCDELEDIMTKGGNVVDFHSCDFFPERWFDLVVVLRCDNTFLYSRLETRGYNAKKIAENIECEIMQVVLDEAQDSYRKEIVVELQSDTVEQMQQNCEQIQNWARKHIK